ncbi:MAG: Gfo/Idh/MocA family protein [Parvibaculaceae bacterium]
MIYRVGVIGLGLMGDVHVRAFQGHAAFEVVAVADPNGAVCEAVAQAQGVAARYASPHELIARETLDILTIATPPRYHAELAIAGFARGCHVLCEKPMAMSAGEAQAMLQAASASGKVHVLGHQSRFNPVRARIRELVLAGYIGTPRHALYHHFAPGNTATARWSWWSSREEGGGMLGEYASHQIDLLRWYLGEIAAADGSVTTFGSARPDETGRLRQVTSDDHAEVGLTMTDGAKVRIIVCAASGSRSGPRLELHGSAGSLALDAEDRLWGCRGAGGPEELTVAETRPSLIGWAKNDTFTPAFQRLVEALALTLPEGRAPEAAADFADGLAIQHVLDAARSGRSYRP